MTEEETEEVRLIRLDLKGGKTAFALDHRGIPQIHARFFEELDSATDEELPDPEGSEPRRSDLEEAATRHGWFLFESGAWPVKRIKGISLELTTLIPELQGEEDDDEEEEQYEEEGIVLTPGILNLS